MLIYAHVFLRLGTLYFAHIKPNKPTITIFALFKQPGAESTHKTNLDQKQK